MLNCNAMMRTCFILLGLTAASALPGMCDDALQLEHLNIAKKWLSTLGVEYQDEITPQNSAHLQAVLDSWRNLKPTSQTGDSAKVKPPQFISGVSHQDLFPNFGSRLLRISSFSSELVRTPDYVAALVPGQGTSSQTQFIPNPDHGLLSVGGTMTFSELYVSPDVRASMCEMTGKGSAYDTTSSHCNDPRFLSGHRKREVFGRIANGVTIKTTVSQIPRIQSGVDIAGVPTFNNLRWTPTVTGTFDPTHLFWSASDWKTWSGHLKGLSDAGFHLDPLFPDSCNGSPETNDTCLHDLVRPSVARTALMSLVPKVDIKAYTPFDYVKIAPTTLVEPPSGGKTIYDVTFAWDLHKLLPSSTDRLDALKALAQLQAFRKTQSSSNPPAEPPPQPAADSLWKQRVEMLYVELSDTPAVCTDPVWWNKFRSLVMHED